MRRALWKLTDDQVYVLCEKAHKLLTELYLAYEEWQAWATQQDTRLKVMKRTSVNYAAAQADARGAWKRVSMIEQRIAAQRSFCASLDNEMNTRNPPFWTRSDLDAIDSYRDGIGKVGGGRGNGRRGGL